MENWDIAELKKEIDKVNQRMTVILKEQMDLYDLMIRLLKLLTNNKKSWLLEEEEEGDV